VPEDWKSRFNTTTVRERVSVGGRRGLALQARLL
jgi:hypothetical protein